MNERIRELAVQAGATLEKEYIELSDGQLMLSDNVELDKSNMDLEKFAELIVRQCLAQVDKVDAMLDCDKEKTGVAWVGLAIAKHFGVEE